MNVERDKITLHVNGEDRAVNVAPDEVLVDTLRRELGLNSVRGTCGIGICGTCTVLLDGRVASSCLLLSSGLEERDIVTSEGLVDENRALDSVQEAFVEHSAYQCSYCIPAMVLAVKACLDESPGARVEDVRDYLAGNLCRCGTYSQILDAARSLIESRATEEDGP